MTGFVFTFSLFCTALLQGDPSALQQVELAPVRQIIDAVIPDAGRNTTRGGRYPVVSPLSPHSPHNTPEAPVSWRRLDGSTDHSPVTRHFLHARPIRAPAPPVAL